MTLTDVTRYWFILTLAGSALAVAGALFASHARRRRHDAAPSRACGHCGYDVRGLPTFSCPECGSDLRAVGIVAGRPPAAPLLFFRAVRAAWPRLAGAVVVVAGLTAGVGYVAVAFVLHHDVRPGADATLEPESKAYKVRVGTGGRARAVSGLRGAAGAPYAGERLILKLAGPRDVFNFSTELDVNLATWASTTHHWIDGRAPATPVVPFGRAELEAFFKAQNLASDRPGFRAELDALMTLIEACRTRPVDAVVTRTPVPGFTASDVADATTVSYAASDPAGPALLFGAGGLWLAIAAAVVVTKMYGLRDDATPRRRAGRANPGAATDSPESAPAAGVDAAVRSRTLTVLFSDIKDYTARSAAAPRAGAIDLVRRHRDLARAVLRDRRGTLVKTIGDALLVTFDSATDAVLAGLDIQAAVAADNAAFPAGQALQLRIAVASGEVVVEAGDVYGETVNLAARLQGVAAPGTVICSAATRSLVNGREVAVRPAGTFALPGFPGHVEAFTAVAGESAAGGAGRPRASSNP